MNRAERRERAKQIAKEDHAEKCPMCGKKSLFIAVPTHNHLCDVMCELCEKKVHTDIEGLIPYTYCNLRAIYQISKGGE